MRNAVRRRPRRRHRSHRRLHLGAHGARRQRGDGRHRGRRPAASRAARSRSRSRTALGPYERNSLRVHDELETLARNEAPGLGADTVQPLDGPEDGVQRYAMWRCGR